MQEIEKKLRRGATMNFSAHGIEYEVYCEKREGKQMFIVRPNLEAISSVEGVSFKKFVRALEYVRAIGGTIN